MKIIVSKIIIFIYFFLVLWRTNKEWSTIYLILVYTFTASIVLWKLNITVEDYIQPETTDIWKSLLTRM